MGGNGGREGNDLSCGKAIALAQPTPDSGAGPEQARAALPGRRAGAAVEEPSSGGNGAGGAPPPPAVFAAPPRAGGRAPAPMPAADYLVNALARAGVEYVFGVIGGDMFPLSAAMAKGPITPIACKHEAGAAFMADGFARASGRLGVCAAAAGPGSTNLITGMASALADSVPVLALTGQVATRSFGKGALQESSAEGIDIVDIFKAMTRYSALVFKPDLLRDMVHKALRCALGGRPGPVHLNLPADVMSCPMPDGHPVGLPAIPRSKTHEREAIQAAARHLLRARRPAILAGHGAVLSDASDELRLIAEMLQIPVATTAKAKGAFPEDHALSLGCFGYSGSPRASWYLLEGGVDVLLAVGTSFNEWGTVGWDRRLQPAGALLQVDIDPYEIGKNYRATVPLQGDAKAVLTEIWYELRRARPRCAVPVRPALVFPEDRPRVKDAHLMSSTASPIKPQRLLADLQASLPRNTLVFVDGGANRSWAIHYWQSVYPRTFFCATGLAALGYGIAAPIGGKFAAPDRPVVAIVDDAGFLMHGLEVGTAVDYRMPVVWVTLNGTGARAAGAARPFSGRRDAAPGPRRVDFARIAEGLGAQGFPISEPGQITPAFMSQILASGRPTVLDVHIDPDELAPFGGRVATPGELFGG